MKTLPVFVFVSWALVVETALGASLVDLERQALASDAGLVSLSEQVEAVELNAQAAGALDDPRLGLKAANFPVDSFAFDQEPMTQAIVSLSQAFPAGETRRLKRERGERGADVIRAKALSRRREVLRQLRMDWLSAWWARQQQSLLEERQSVLSLMTKAQEGRYGSGEVSQTGVASTELKRIQVDEGLIRIQGQYQSALARVGRWVDQPPVLDWPDRLPEHLNVVPEGDLEIHPELATQRSRMDQSQLDIELARQTFKPGFMVETAYGYRDGRDDFLSLGVSMNLPVFSDQRNEQQLTAREYELKAQRATLEDQRRQLASQVEALKQDTDSLDRRIKQYQSAILPQAQHILSLAESDYAAGRGDLVRSLEAKNQWIGHRMSLLELRQQRAQKLIQLLWLLEEVSS